MGVSWARGRGTAFPSQFTGLENIQESLGRYTRQQRDFVCLTPREAETMKELVLRLGREEKGQDIAEYAVMLAVILVIVVGTIRLIGTNANNVFSSVASSVQ